MMNFQKMMKQAQEMQFRIQEMQEKLADIDVQGESGGGLVKITMSCSGKVSHVDIDQTLMDSDKETLEDLIAAAINNANEAKDARIKNETANMMEGLGLPADAAGSLPF